MSCADCHLLLPTHRCLQPYEEPDEGDETEEVEEEEEEEDKAPQDGANIGDEDILRSQSGYESGYNTGMAALHRRLAVNGWLTDRARMAVNSLESEWRRSQHVKFLAQSPDLHARRCLLERAACLPAGAETEGVLSGGETDAEDMFESGSEALSLLQDLGSPQQATLDPAEQGVQPFEVLRSRRRRLQAEVETDTDWQGTGAEGDQEEEGAAQQVGRDGWHEPGLHWKPAAAVFTESMPVYAPHPPVREEGGSHDAPHSRQGCLSGPWSPVTGQDAHLRADVALRQRTARSCRAGGGRKEHRLKYVS